MKHTNKLDRTNQGTTTKRRSEPNGIRAEKKEITHGR